MGGAANFPGSLDTDGSLYDVTDSSSTLQAAHHNNIKEAVKAIEAKLGIHVTAVATSVDYRLGNPTGAHNHGGASGHGVQINPTVIPAPSGAVGAPAYLYDHFMATAIHGGATLLATQVLAPSGAPGTPSTAWDHMKATAIHQSGWFQASGVFAPSSAYQASGVFQPSHGERITLQYSWQGSLMASVGFGPRLGLPRTMQLESIDARLRLAPSGATTAIDINFGPTSLWVASQGNRVIFPAGASYYGHASSNLVTYASGLSISVDVDAVGSSDPGQDLSITFLFRE